MNRLSSIIKKTGEVFFTIIKPFLKIILYGIVRFFLKIVIFFKNDRKVKFEKNDIKKVLIFGYTGLGNFVLYTPAIKTIRKYLQNAKFTLLHGNDTGCQEVLSGSGLIDNYLVIDRNANPLKKLRVIEQVRKDEYDLIISDFHNDKIFLALLLVFSGAKYRLGHISSPGWKGKWDCIYNIPVKMKEEQHEIDRYLELAYALKINENDIDRKPFFYLGKKDIQFALSFMKSNRIDIEKNLIISVQMGTSPNMRWKQWGLKKYRELCDRILELPNTVVIFHGSYSERDMIEEVARQMKYKPIVMAGRTTIKQAAAIIKYSNNLICNDSGLGKISIALGTTTITIWGPSDYPRAKAWEKGHYDIRRDLECSPCFRMEGTKKVKNCPFNYRCINDISVDEVFNTFLKVYRKNKDEKYFN